MKFYLYTGYQALTLMVTVTAKTPCTLFITVQDAEMPDTFLSKRSYTVTPSGEDKIFIQMPVTGKNILVHVYEHHDYPDKLPESFSVNTAGVRLYSLPSLMKAPEVNSLAVREWVRFAMQFSFNAGVLPCYSDRYYVSSEGGYKLLYTQQIIDDGKVNVTPMRVDPDTRIIEAAKEKLLPMTVGARFFIATHEFCHTELNDDIANELEADLNSIVIGLCCGFSKYEARQAFLYVFLQDEVKSNPEVQERQHHIMNFIDKYESLESEHL